MTTKNKSNNVVYSYATDVNDLEEENRFLKETVESLRKDIEKFKKTPLLVCEVHEIVGDKALVRLQNGNEFFVEISDECDKLKAGDGVLTEQKNLTIIKKIPIVKKFNVEKFVIVEKPNLTWKQIGGLDQLQKTGPLI